MNKHAKILAVILLGLFIAYNLFGLNGLTVIFWAIALCVGYGLLLASMRIWQKRKITFMKIGILFEGNPRNPGGFNQSLVSVLILNEIIEYRDSFFIFYV